MKGLCSVCGSNQHIQHPAQLSGYPPVSESVDMDESDTYGLAGTLANARYWHSRCEDAERVLNGYKVAVNEAYREASLLWAAMPEGPFEYRVQKIRTILGQAFAAPSTEEAP